MALSNLPQREEYLKKKRNRKFLKYGVAVFLTILIIGLLSYISHRPKIRINGVKLSGGILVTQADVETKSLEYLNGSYLWLFPKNNAFLYPRKGLEKYLKENFKRIDTISIGLKGFQTLDIKIAERKPFAIWCDTLPGDEVISEDGYSDTRCYFMDQNSAVFAPSPQFSGDAYFKYYGRVSTSSPLGNYYISSTTEFAEISDFVSNVKNLSIHPLYIVAKENDEFSLVLSGGGEIYFDMKGSLSKTTKNLEALLQTPDLAKNLNGNLPINYIDLRYGNKLFYKLKNEQ